MNAERHYDDEALITLACADAATTAKDLHLRTCRPCADAFLAFRNITTSMKETAVWSAPLKHREPSEEFAERLRREQAEDWVRQLTGVGREAWERRLAARPNWNTEP